MTPNRPADAPRLVFLVNGDKQAEINNAKGHLFEVFIARLLEAAGYEEPKTTNLNVRRLGIELDIETRHSIHHHRFVVECKAYEKNLPAEKLNAFYGKLIGERFQDATTAGLFVALPGLAQEASSLADTYVGNDPNFLYWDAYTVVERLQRHKIVFSPPPTEAATIEPAIVIHESGTYSARKVLDAKTHEPTRIEVWSAKGPVADPALELLAKHDYTGGLPIDEIRLTADETDHSPPPFDLMPYLRYVIERTDSIRIQGVGTGAGSVRDANQYPIEQLFTPLSTRMPIERFDEGRLTGSDALSKVLPKFDRLLIEGQPGAGKTTFLRLVACLFARDRASLPCPNGSSWRERYLELEDPPERIPLLISIPELLQRLEEEKAAGKDDRLRLLELAPQGDQYPSKQQWIGWLAEGRVILLLDGLDEMADPDLRKRTMAIFQDASTAWKRCRIVVTSRPIDTDIIQELGFHRVVVEPFDNDQIREFIQRWVGALQHQGNYRVGSSTEAYRETLSKAIVDDVNVRRIARNPVMLTCLCVVHWNEGKLPDGRSRVYQAVIRWLFNSRGERRNAAGYTPLFAEPALQQLALAMMDHPSGKRSLLPFEEAAVALLEPRRGDTAGDSPLCREFPNRAKEELRQIAEEWLRFECLHSGIIEESGDGELKFWHLTFQEFLAAQELAGMSSTEWWPIIEPRLEDRQWRETIDLLPGCLLGDGKRTGPVDELLHQIVGLRDPDRDLPGEARVAGLLGRMLRPLEVFQYKPRPAVQEIYEETLARSMEIFEVEGAKRVPVGRRIEVAEALGRAGDPRLRDLDENFIEVPGTGGQLLGRYPVTVEEFARFIDDDGYTRRELWKEGWKARKERGWESPHGWDEQFSHPNRPVVGVSWFEAAAYCEWLTHIRSSVSGRAYYLPTKNVWQSAAAPPKGLYPWGRLEPTREHANFLEEGPGHPTPVGIYPAGEGPQGHRDLAGNVWEWCDDSSDPKGCRLQGGSWSELAREMRSAFIFMLSVGGRNDDFGFRVAASLPPRTI